MLDFGEYIPSMVLFANSFKFFYLFFTAILFVKIGKYEPCNA